MFSISLESCEVNEFQEVATHFVESINIFLQDLDAHISSPIEVLELKVLEGVRALCRQLLEMIVSKVASEQVSGSVICPECEQECRPWCKRERGITTLCGVIRMCGVIRIERWVYRCALGHNHAPWDLCQKLRGQYTHRVAEVMCRLVARLDFREASEELSSHGIEVSHTTLHQKVREWSQGLRVPEQVDTQRLEENQRWYVSCDGCHTNSREGWKEVKVGCIYKDYPQQGFGSIASARTSSMRYVASRNDATHFGKELFSLATHSGIYQEDIDTQEIVFIGDGAAWIWNLAAEYFPNAVEIVDVMHAASHLYNVAKVAFEETQTQMIEDWVEMTKPYLYAGNITEVVARIRDLATQNSETSETLEREARYFEKHAKRMRYQEFREKGYQIGSGVIESACKHVVAQRCKQASMRWDKPGINAVLEWRCLDKNKAWNRYWYPDTKAA